MSTQMTLVSVRLNEPAYLGRGGGSGFSRTSNVFIPGATFRGAVAASWWAQRPVDHDGDSAQSRFEALFMDLRFSDLVPSADDDPIPKARALDRASCKYPIPVDQAPHCPDDYPVSVTLCPVCGHTPEPGKGARIPVNGARLDGVTRVDLNELEMARDELLFERQALISEPPLVGLIDGAVGELLGEGQRITVGGASSVAGAATIEKMATYSTPTINLPAGPTTLRLELMTPGCYVDDFGRASAMPSEMDLRWALKLPDTAEPCIERSFVRWDVGRGFHSAARRPKPQDPVATPHSVYHVTLRLDQAQSVPVIVSNLGLRTTEGCGWATVSRLNAWGSDHAQS